MFGWLKKKKPKPDENASAMAAIDKRNEVAQSVINTMRAIKLNPINEKRRLDLPIDFHDRRHQPA